MDEQLRKYNIKIRELLDMISADLPNNPMVATIHRRFRVAVATDRTFIIEETAPELLRYREFIADNRIDELIDNNWEEQIEKEEDALMYEIDNNSLRDMVGLLRSIWTGYDDEQRAYVRKAMRTLLSCCIKYHKAKAAGQA